MARPALYLCFACLPVPTTRAFRVQSFVGLGPGSDFKADNGLRYNYFLDPKALSDSNTCEGFSASMARWDTTGEGASEAGGPPGLDGGIEYFILPSLCLGVAGDRLQGRAGRPVTCEELEGAVARALDAWALRHPTIYFHRISSEKRAELLIGSDRPTLDLEADNPANEARAIAYAQLGLVQRRSKVTSTAGHDVSGWAVARARIQFNPDHCFYVAVSHLCMDNRPTIRMFVLYGLGAVGALTLGAASLLACYGNCARHLGDRNRDRQNRAKARALFFTIVLGVLLVPFGAWVKTCGASVGCFSFETILRHESGHVLGIDHPDTMVDKVPVGNLDNDGKDGNFIPIDAGSPCKNLTVVPKRYRKSIMVSHGQKTQRVRLSHDDLAALHFLYPHSHRTKSRRPLPVETWSEEKVKVLVEDVAEHAHLEKQSGTIVDDRPKKWLGKRTELLLLLKGPEVRRLFTHDQVEMHADSNGDGVISLQELSTALKALNIVADTEDVGRLLENFDIDKDGVVTTDELHREFDDVLEDPEDEAEDAAAHVAYGHLEEQEL